MKERLQAWGDSHIVPIVGVFAFNERGEVLLLKRHADDLGGGRWGTPGGRIDPGESAAVAIARECYEETGLRNLPFVLLGRHRVHMPHGAVDITSYHATVSGDVQVNLDPEEHQAYVWIHPELLTNEPGILWGMPTILRDFKLGPEIAIDPTLADGSKVEFINRTP